ncbi:MAG: YDG domain-containing protein, partial [Candidatus Omnitrophota bacterium]|nr:YDG domain-containing protein [Candidatus Omnitrophota bacterium]
ITANNKTYDGTTAATLNTTLAALSGVVAGDTVTLDTTAATGAFASKDIGTDKLVTISGLTISGGSSANYSLTQPTTTANITAAPAPNPTPTPTQSNVSHATNESNVVISDSITEAYSTLSVNEARMESVQTNMATYVTSLQKFLVPSSAAGLKVTINGEKVYIGG